MDAVSRAQIPVVFGSRFRHGLEIRRWRLPGDGMPARMSYECNAVEQDDGASGRTMALIRGCSQPGQRCNWMLPARLMAPPTACEAACPSAISCWTTKFPAMGLTQSRNSLSQTENRLRRRWSRCRNRRWRRLTLRCLSARPRRPRTWPHRLSTIHSHRSACDAI